MHTLVSALLIALNYLVLHVKRKSVFLFAAFQAHLSKIILQMHGTRDFQWSITEEDRYCLFLGRYSPEGNIFVVCEAVFCVNCRTCK